MRKQIKQKVSDDGIRRYLQNDLLIIVVGKIFPSKIRCLVCPKMCSTKLKIGQQLKVLSILNTDFLNHEHVWYSFVHVVRSED